MGNANRKASRDEMAHARQVIEEAFPGREAEFGGHGDYGSHRAPRDHTIAFRIRDRRGKYRSNVAWVLPELLSQLTVENVRAIVARVNGA